MRCSPDRWSGCAPLAELQELEARAVIGTYARNPVAFTRGEGTRLWDSEGNEYLDFLAGISVVQIGHCHPALVAAVTEQAARLMHAGNLYYTEPGMRLAARLSDLTLGGKAFLCNSGTEAIEAALKLARRARPGGRFVTMERGFHGRTMGALSATPQEAKQAPFAPLVPGFDVVPHDDAAAVAAAVTPGTAAVLLEPIQGEGGIWPLSEQTLQAARAACDEHGALLILDEIQCGMGRTGDWWAFEASGVRPDAMTVAKGLGGGLPIGALLTSPAYADVLQPGDHGSTFAGGPMVAAGANAVLDVLAAERFLDSVAPRGERLRAGLEALGLDVRGRGLMLAFGADDAPALARRLLLEQRLVVNATGPDTIRLLPPLTVSEAEIDEAVGRVGAALGPPAHAQTPR
jgi:predicted acetylornithine/succinylornithine family transaminase